MEFKSIVVEAARLAAYSDIMDVQNQVVLGYLSGKGVFVVTVHQHGKCPDQNEGSTMLPYYRPIYVGTKHDCSLII